MPRPPDAPRIVFLIEVALSPTLYPPKWVDDAMKELREITTSWHTNGSLSDLREKLGVTAKKGGQRTWAAYARHIEILECLRKAARSGKDVSTYRKAADAIDIDEKSIQRTWKEHGGWLLSLLSKDVEQLPSDRADATRKVISLLPP